jgi:hypothetical protein
MSVEAGHDYAWVRKMTAVLETGVGPASAVVTRRLVAIIPHQTIGVRGRTATTTTFTIRGRPTREALDVLLSDPGTTPHGLDELLRKVKDDVPKGPVLEALDSHKRIKIRGGSFSRGVAMNERAKGLVGHVGYWTMNSRPSREELEQFQRFFQGDPRTI